MSNWNASNYRQRKAERLSKLKPQWFTNPDTGEKFYLRPVRAVLSSFLAGTLPSGLTNKAIKAWKDKGVSGLDKTSAEEIVSQMSPAEVEESLRETQRLSVIIQEACVVPLISALPADKIVFTDEWKAQAQEGLKELNPESDEPFDPIANVVDPRELDEADTKFLFRWAAGLVLDVPVKGGGAVPMDDLSRFRKKLARGSRSRADRKSVRKAS